MQLHAFLQHISRPRPIGDQLKNSSLLFRKRSDKSIFVVLLKYDYSYGMAHDYLFVIPDHCCWMSDVNAIIPSCYKRFKCWRCRVTEITELQLLILTYYTVKMLMRSSSGNPVMSLKKSSWPPWPGILLESQVFWKRFRRTKLSKSLYPTLCIALAEIILSWIYIQ